MQDDEIEIPHPTSEESKAITAISKDNVHRICSGQVVLSLAVAVKELVENSLDAGATLVEVKLINQGLESLEVSDNGCGVEEKNLEGMTAKYHTSKLKDFVDLQSVETFGFRGEALSSLCALANMSITTRHSTADVALKIDLNNEGRIERRQHAARSVGTTVTLTNLFETLPVRRRDFVKNIKKEFNKMCQMLQAYCLVSKGVRIICSNHTLKGHKTVVMQTHGSMNVLANISAIFGSRQINDILEIKCPLGGSSDKVKDRARLLEEIRAEMDDSVQVTADDISQLLDGHFKLEGYISNCSHGCGRSSKDRQYFYVNSRPCDPKNISKVVNDYYHRYNVNQVPFVYLNVMTNRQSVDVNLTPDKRQLLLSNEKVLLALIKKALVSTFGNIPSTYKMQNTSLNTIVENVSKSVQNEQDEVEIAVDDVPAVSSQRFSDVLTQWKRTGTTEGAQPQIHTHKRKCTNEITVRTSKMQKIQQFLTKEDPISKEFRDVSDLSESEEQEIDDSRCKDLTTNSLFSSIDDVKLSYNGNKSSQSECDQIKEHEAETEQENIEFDESDSDAEYPKKTCNELITSMSEIELMLRAEENLMEKRQRQLKLERLRFKCEINPTQNKTAEAELQKEISKSHFEHMEIVGQFNLGFIIAKLDTDLFIVDQHATDEKYNFETLQKTTQLQHQPLTIAQPLELTAANEMVLLDHVSVFEKNGFSFDIDVERPPTKKVRLLSKPFSKNWEFGKEDIDELIFMLQDAPVGSVCRPSRISAMFASRACRKSVMIGKPLKKSTMQTLIRHMGEIEQPWNCPHGRPTMRHLVNIAMLQGAEDENDDDEAT